MVARLGRSEAQWAVSLLPRIELWLPAGTILEIGCGRGRWSRFLRAHGSALVLTDVLDSCVEACRRLFAGDAGVRCLDTDGRTLGGVADRSVDFVFSFDSLVHAEMEVVESYLGEIARVLAPAGAAFLHTSNFGALLAATPGTWNHHWRAESASADLFLQACERVGLHCRTQEIVDWGGVEDCDCLSVVVPAGSPRATPLRRARNPHFMGEAHSSGVRVALYGPDAPGARRAPAAAAPDDRSGGERS